MTGLAAVVVARRHRPQRVSVCGYLVDTFCLGVKNTLGPELMNERDLPDFLHMFFISRAGRLNADGRPTGPAHAVARPRSRIIEALIGVAGIVLGAVVGGLLTTRSRMRLELEYAHDRELRDKRLLHYQRLFHISRVVPREWLPDAVPSRAGLRGSPAASVVHGGSRVAAAPPPHGEREDGRGITSPRDRDTARGATADAFPGA